MKKITMFSFLVFVFSYYSNSLGKKATCCHVVYCLVSNQLVYVYGVFRISIYAECLLDAVGRNKATLDFIQHKWSSDDCNPADWSTCFSCALAGFNADKIFTIKITLRGSVLWMFRLCDFLNVLPDCIWILASLFRYGAFVERAHAI